MAQAVTTDFVSERSNVISRVLGGIGNFFVSMAENNHRVKELERLSAMSDEELAKIGLRRDQIIHHAFADMMHI